MQHENDSMILQPNPNIYGQLAFHYKSVQMDHKMKNVDSFTTYNELPPRRLSKDNI